MNSIRRGSGKPLLLVHGQVVELARRGVGGATVALAPGGFWSPGQLRFFNASLQASIRLVRLLQPVMPAITGSPVGRTLLLSQLSARPWALSADLALREMRSYAHLALVRCGATLARPRADAGRGARRLAAGAAGHRLGTQGPRAVAQPGEARRAAVPRRKAALVRPVGALPAVG